MFKLYGFWPIPILLLEAKTIAKSNIFNIR